MIGYRLDYTNRHAGRNMVTQHVLMSAPAVPRKGETVTIGEVTYEVTAVDHRAAAVSAYLTTVSVFDGIVVTAVSL